MTFASDQSIPKNKLEILKRVNNPKIIKLLNDCKFSEQRFPDIYSYISDMINCWRIFLVDYIIQNRLYTKNIEKSNCLNEILLNKTEFSKKKNAFDKILNRLDKKYRFSTKIRGAILISVLRKIYGAY